MVAARARAERVFGESIVSGRDAPEVLQAAEHAFDEIASAVGLSIERAGLLAACARGDHRLGPSNCEQRPEGVGIVGLVSQQPERRLDGGEDRRCDGDVGRVAGRQDEGDRTAASISQRVDLRRAAAARAADRLRCFPLLPPPADRCALMWVASMANSSGMAPAWATCSNTERQTPCRTHLLYRLYRVVCGPYAGGASRQRQPDFKTCRMPLITRRSSTRRAPGRPC